MYRIITTLLLLPFISSLSACSPEVGSDAWCEDMVEKPRGDWSTNEATAFAKSCIFKDYDDD
jgi:hypothetical protein